MTDDLLALEERIEQFISLCQGLRAENQELRTRIAVAEAERKRLSDKIERACSRLEALMQRFPEE